MPAVAKRKAPRHPRAADLLQQTTAPSSRDFETNEAYLTYAYEPQVPITLAQWTIPTIRSARDRHAEGEFIGSGLLADILLTDSRIVAAVLRRIGPPLGIPREVDPPKRWNGKGVGEKIRLEVLSLFSVLSAACAPGVIAFCVWALAIMGFAILQVVWRVEGGMLWPELRPWPLSLSRYNKALRRYQVSTTEGLVTVEPGDGKWVLLEPMGPLSFMFGAIRSGSLLWADRSYVARDRSNHSAAHGSVSPVGILGEGIKVNSKEGRAFTAATRNLQNPRAGVTIPFGSKIDTFEPKTMAWQIFTQTITSDNADIELLFCGLSNDGAYKSIPQIDGVRFDLVRTDVDTMAAKFHAGVVVPFVGLNYGEDADLVPPLKWKVPDPREEQRVKALGLRHQLFAQTVKAYQDAGLVTDETEVTRLAERFEVPVPKLAPKPVGQPPGGGGEPPPMLETTSTQDETSNEDDAPGKTPRE